MPVDQKPHPDHARANRPEHFAWRKPRSVSGILKIVLLLALINSVEAFADNSVTLRWDPSPSVNVGGYRIYYGGVSGLYTNTLDVGNSTTATLRGLEASITYYFVVSAYGTSGSESVYSNEATYTTPAAVSAAALFKLQLNAGLTGQMILSGSGAAQRTYDVQASTDLQNWIVIARLTTAAGGTLTFTDTNAANFPSRFYRLAETQPSVQLRLASNKQPIVTVIGQFNRSYQLQASPDLVNWTAINSTTLGTNGAVEITDATAANQPARFYRTLAN